LVLRKIRGNLFFLNPLEIKNPYNNIPFNKSTLYNIYFFIKFNTNIYCDIFFKFFNENFDLKIFFHKYEYILREISLEKYVSCSPNSLLHKEIIKMIENYNSFIHQSKYKILIDEDFPKEKLIKIMKPYLLLYYKSQYSLIQHIKYDSLQMLNNKLNIFQKYNPVFGRKIIILEKKYVNLFRCKTSKKYAFNDKHILFNQNNNHNFLLNHTRNIFYNDNYSDNDNDNENENYTNENADNYSDTSDTSDENNVIENSIIENNILWNSVYSEDET
jgi:hypothetical protein